MRTLTTALLGSFLIADLVGACTSTKSARVEPPAQVLFVCEHGNVKSLMAATYFNQLAAQRGLPFHAIARGKAPDSDSAPPAIAAALRAEGFDVSSFHPAAVTAADLEASVQVVTIGTSLMEGLQADPAKAARWDDVPAASEDFAAASAALKGHVAQLVERLGGGTER